MEVAVFALVPILAVFAAITWVVWQVLKGLRFLLVKLFGGVGHVGGRAFGFVRAELIEVVQFAGALLTLVVLLPLTVLNFVIGRWSTARHYGRAVEDELISAGLGLYRMSLSHPLRFVGLGGVLEGVERRIPEVVDRAPRRATKKSALRFDGYDVTGTLPAGGSGAQLFLARPKPDTLERLKKPGREVPHEVVIKSFALVQGSTLPQIVRESRALEAANRLGLVLEHHLEPERFFYVMEYVRGEDLDMVVQRMHQRTGPEGLGEPELLQVLGYGMDLVRTLDRFHTGGLWHKDVKPTNLIVSGDRAHLVDFGLVTPLQSALTLTTHGTEYYRDPEMVRLAMQGVKVHEVDGVKFDLYSAGAVLYTMVENSFPAHGSLSQITRRCPEALAWVVRRSMADIESRYRSAWEMLDDLAAIASAPDPFALRPADLPSVQRGETSERAPFYAFDEDAPQPREQRSARPSAEPAAAASPYLLAEQAKPLPLDTRRRRRRRVLTACAASFVLVSLVVKALREHEHSRWTTPTAVAGGASYPMPDLRPGEVAPFLNARSIVDEWQGDLQHELEGLRYDVQGFVDGAHRSASHFVETAALPPTAEPRTTEAPAPAAETEAALAELRALVLNDHVNKAAAGSVAHIEERLRDRGVNIVGTEATEVFAGVWNAVGTGHIGDEGARRSLQAYLDRSPDLDMIVWVADGTDPVVLVRGGPAD